MSIQSRGDRRSPQLPRRGKPQSLAARITASWPVRLGWLAIAIPAIGAADAPRGPALAVSAGLVSPTAGSPSPVPTKPATFPDPPESPVTQPSALAGSSPAVSPSNPSNPATAPAA